MDDQNRYEEVPQKENKFLKALKSFGLFVKNVWLNFIESFKYNNCKLAALLTAVPGVFLGFFLIFHSQVVKVISFDMPGNNHYVFGFDFTSIVLFVLMLFGILNIFGSAALSSKKNLGSVIRLTITSSVIVIAGVLYLVSVFVYINGCTSGALSPEGGFELDVNFIISIISVIISMLSVMAGCVLAFINYDRTYEKVDR